jgi:outer membrane protein assembly factor BamB
VGLAFPTPVTDGANVYVMTFHGTVACFQLADGKRVWSASTKYKGHHGLMASPRLFGDLVLTGWIDTDSADPRLVAFDKMSGKVRWEVNIKGDGAATEAQSRSGGSLVVMTIAKTPVVVCSSGKIVRLPDGKVYASSIPRSCGTYAVDDGADAIFGAGHHDRGSTRWRLDLTIEGEELKITERFNLKETWGPASSVVADGKWFVKGAVLDSMTGQPLGSTNAVTNLRKVQTAPNGNHTILVAGGHVYGLYEKEEGPKDKPKTKTGVCEVFTVDGKKVATNVLRPAKREGEAVTQFQEQGWPAESFSYCCAMNIGGDRLYIVSDDYLYCIGGK